MKLCPKCKEELRKVLEDKYVKDYFDDSLDTEAFLARESFNEELLFMVSQAEGLDNKLEEKEAGK